MGIADSFNHIQSSHSTFLLFSNINSNSFQRNIDFRNKIYLAYKLQIKFAAALHILMNLPWIFWVASASEPGM